MGLGHEARNPLRQAALLTARADDVATARREVGETLDRLLTALTARPAG